MPGTDAAASDIAESGQARWLMVAAYDELLLRYDALVMPTVPITASMLPAPDASPGEVFSRATEHLGNTAPFDITGHPAISVPADQVAGLPTSLMIVGRHFDDAAVLRLAFAFEHHRNGFPMPARPTG